MPTSAGDLLRDAVSAARGLLASIEDDDLARPTPCSGWDLRALAGHMVGQYRGFAAAIERGDAARAAYAPVAVRNAADLLRAWDESVDLLLGACSAAAVDRRVRLVEIAPEATLPVSAVIRIQLVDTVVHAWDVATGLGTDYRPPPETLDVVAAVVERIPDGPGRTVPGAAFAPSVPMSSDDPWATALARLGRRRT